MNSSKEVRIILLIKISDPILAQPDILCLNEIKIDDTLIKSLDFDLKTNSYFDIKHTYWNCCKPPNKGYAGTAILVSKNCPVKPVKVTYDFGIAKHA